MKRTISLGAGCALATAALLVFTTVAKAQLPPEVTITFKLAINGSVPAHDSFAVSWAENGIELCPSPCAGGGRTYTATMRWPQGNQPIQFVFDRFGSPRGLNNHPRQQFGQQTVSPEANRTVSAFYTYGLSGASAPTPATGTGTLPLAAGAGLIAVGVATMLLAARRSRRIDHTGDRGMRALSRL